MLTTGRDILFNFPEAGVLLLLLFPFFLGQIVLTHYRHRQQSAYAPSSHLSRLLIARSPVLRWTKMIGWALIWLLVCLALMQPFGNIRYTSSSLPLSAAQAQQAPHEIIFLVDTSASMRVPDGYEGQTRLESAKNILEDILSQLHGQTVSLYAFTSQLSAVVPPTLDYIFTRLAIKDLHIDQGDVGGTRFAPVLAALKEQAFPKPSPKRYTVIMLTDGGDTQLESLSGEARIQATQTILNAIPNPEELHLHLFTIGLGSLQSQPIPHVSFEGKPVFSKLEPEILQQIAAQERGKYDMAARKSSWNLAQELIAQIGHQEMMEVQHMQTERQVLAAQKEDLIVDWYYQIPLGLALLFYLLNLLLPDVRRI